MANDRQQRAARAEQMRKDREKAEKRQRNLITIGIVGVVVVLIAAAGIAINLAMGENEKDRALNTPKNVTDDYGIVYTAADVEEGGDAEEGATDGEADGEGETEAPAEGEPVSVELYEDFQCPACQSFEQASGTYLKQMVESGAIEITYRPFSFLDGQSTNQYSSRATNVALCALDAGGVQDYVTVHDYLYANQPAEGGAGPENGDLAEAVEGLGITGLESCIRTERFSRWVEDARNAGTERGVNSTPTVYVAGEQVENPSPQSIQAAIEAAQG